MKTLENFTNDEMTVYLNNFMQKMLMFAKNQTKELSNKEQMFVLENTIRMIAASLLHIDINVLGIPKDKALNHMTTGIEHYLDSMVMIN